LDVTLTDTDIVERSLSEPQLFAAIFERHFVAIHGYFARRGPHSDADDLAGEVFRIAFEKRAGFDPNCGEVRPWLFGIAHNVRSRNFRSSGRKERAVNLDPPII
jgi:RNA polymerase sigma-70 factor (ECF subfamily)